jgi:hypothetical protein
MWPSSVRSSRRTTTKHGEPRRPDPVDLAGPAAADCDPDDPTTWTTRHPTGWFLAEAVLRSAENAGSAGRPPTSCRGGVTWAVSRAGHLSRPVPAPDEPGDDGRQVEGRRRRSRGDHRLSVRSRGRALLMLFLFSDVGRAMRHAAPGGLSPGHQPPAGPVPRCPSGVLPVRCGGGAGHPGTGPRDAHRGARTVTRATRRRPRWPAAPGNPPRFPA